LREALAPDYEVEREVASGGMGVVFLGRDVTLDRRVAIKVVRPELATATAAERFIREGKILASLSHPNIVPIHRAGESHGLFYYVMDYLEAETLAGRLARGPLAPEQAVAVAADVLAALDAIHRRGVVHRDIKPANIFLLEGRAVVGDLGVAKTTDPGSPPLTGEGRAVGSPGYMAPEQMAGRDVTPATDLFAVGLVLYEALAGQPWPYLTEPARADWSRVPANLVPVLERALAWHSPDRWRDAAEFRRALGAAGGPSRARRALRWAAAAVIVVGAALVVDHFVRPAAPRASTLRIRIRPFEVAPLAMRWLSDSLAAALVQGLGASPDFTAELSRGGAPGPAPELALQGRADVAMDGTLRLSLGADTTGGGAARTLATAQGHDSLWRQLAADSLGHQLLLWIWSEQGGKLAADLPVHALPHTPRGLTAWIAAEHLFARAQWEDAYEAYRQAIQVDSTCLLCRVRLTDVGRWLGKDQDRSETARYRMALDSFPPHYRVLIRASFAPHDLRWRLLDSATERAGDFGLAWFIKGDETFHRGPLDGYLRHEALAAMRRATGLWPDFAPAWEHLAWIAIGEGDSADAGRALDSLAQLGTGQDLFSAGLRALLNVCYQWRFAPPEAAAKYTYALLRDPRVGQFPSLAAGARYLMTCDTPAGSVWLGEAFQRVGRADLEGPGLLAQMYGYLALGKPAAARAAGARMRSLGAEPALELFLAELPAALLLADSTGPAEIGQSWPAMRRALDPYTSAAGGDRRLRQRAAWLLALVGRRAGAGDAEASRRYRRLLEDEGVPHPLGTLLDADAEAMRSHPESALSLSEPLLALDSAGQAGDPFFRSILHLLRAQWHATQGDTVQAVRDLRWSENNDLRIVDIPAPTPEAAEIDWSLGTLGRWRRARLLDRSPGDAEACAAYGAVARHWAHGEAMYAARADSARRRFDALHCGSGA
jgi:tRNA A-37 threonylcarbamoyl transferase component Bud32/tetratricopeptide (TPR) repeat protein